MNFWGAKNTAFFEPKNWWKNYVYWLLKSSCFGLFGNGKYGLLLRQKVNEKMIFTDYWNVLVLNFSEKENAVFFEAKSWWKDDIYQLMKSSCFELFHDGKCSLFWDKKFMKRWYLLITEKFMFSATKKFLFWAFRLLEYDLFLSQKGDVKVIFVWSFWAFHDIPEPGKYGFSCSVKVCF